jgi:GTP-binding protein Era
MTDPVTKAGFVAVIGAPNAGKSTLVNALVGQKVAIVSPKAQTTRARLLGIAINNKAQILLVDTPGIFEPRRRLDRAMVAAAWSGAQDADLVLLVVDASEKVRDEVANGLDKGGQPLFVALNKVDLVKKERLLGIAKLAEATATGTSKQEAETAAAKALLEQLQ